MVYVTVEANLKWGGQVTGNSKVELVVSRAQSTEWWSHYGVRPKLMCHCVSATLEGRKERREGKKEERRKKDRGREEGGREETRKEGTNKQGGT